MTSTHHSCICCNHAGFNDDKDIGAPEESGQRGARPKDTKPRGRGRGRGQPAARAVHQEAVMLPPVNPPLPQPANNKRRRKPSTKRQTEPALAGDGRLVTDYPAAPAVAQHNMAFMPQQYPAPIPPVAPKAPPRAPETFGYPRLAIPDPYPYDHRHFPYHGHQPQAFNVNIGNWFGPPPAHPAADLFTGHEQGFVDLTQDAKLPLYQPEDAFMRANIKPKKPETIANARPLVAATAPVPKPRIPLVLQPRLPVSTATTAASTTTAAATGAPKDASFECKLMISCVN